MSLRKITILISIFTLLFISCKKEYNEIDLKKNPKNSTINEYSIVSPKWQLIKENVIIDNIKGNLFVNLNNPIETLFEANASFLKTSGSTGTKEYEKVIMPGEGTTYICSGTGTSCSVSVQRDENGKIIGARITTY